MPHLTEVIFNNLRTTFEEEDKMVGILWLTSCLLLVICAAQEPQENPTCEFDTALTGDWLSTIWGSVTLNDTTITLTSDNLGDDAKNFTWLQCFKSYDTGTIILQSDFFTFFDEKIFFYTCLDIQEINEDLFQIKIRTARKNGDSIPAYGSAIQRDIDFAKYCTSATVLEGYFIRKGQLSSVVECPDPLKGHFDVKYTGNEESACSEGARMDSCNSVLNVSNENCNGTATDLLPDMESYSCVAIGTNQVTVLTTSSGDTTVQAFSCLNWTVNTVYSVSVIEVNQLDMACEGTWKLPRSKTANSKDYTLMLTSSCETTDSSPPPDQTAIETSDQRTDQSDNATVTTDTDSVNPTITQDTNEYNNSSMDNNNTGDNEDDGIEGAATSLMSDGFVMTLCCACIALALSNLLAWEL